MQQSHNQHLFGPRVDNNPDAADHARKRIAQLPDAYANEQTPSKHELAASKAKPVSPVAEALPSLADRPKLSDVSAVTEKIPKPRPLPSMKRPVLIGLAVFIIPLLIFKLQPLIVGQLSYLNADKPATSVPVADAGGVAEAVGPESVISIPKINVNAPIVFAKSNKEAAIQKDLESGVVHYAGTGVPGQPGNSAIFGHSSNDWWEPGNYKFVFVLLDKLVVGDTFSVNHGGKKYIYQVYETKVVAPTEVSVLNQTPDAQMTLITCSPPGTSWKRLVVKAKLTGPPPTTVATNQNRGEDPTKDVGGILTGNSANLASQISSIWDSFLGLFRRQPGEPIDSTTQV